MIRAAVAIAVTLGGCGRFGFDSSTGGGDGGGSGDGSADAMTTGPAGPRWIRGFGPAPAGDITGVLVAGNGGEVVAMKNFQTTLAIEGDSFTGLAQFGSVAVGRYDAAGTIVSKAVLDATGYCEGRGLTMAGDDALVTGLTIGVTAVPAYGPCSIVTNRQDPFAIRISRAAQQTLTAHWMATGANGQGWRGAAFADGTFAMAGIYGVNLTVGTPLPAAVADPSAFVGRYATPSVPRWTRTGAPASVVTQPGGLIADGDDLCAMGSFDGPITLFGKALPHAGNSDVWVARFDPTGVARWVRAIGSPGLDSSFGSGSIAVGPNGGCIVAVAAAGDLTIDSLTLPVSQGPAVLVQFAADGTAIAGIRTPVLTRIANLGARLVVAVTVTGTITFPTMTYTAQGQDILIGEVDASNEITLLGVIGGAGDQSVTSFDVIASDAVAIGVKSIGALVFGNFTSDSGATAVHVVASLGL